MKKNITIYLFAGSDIFACSEDKGNYDYAPANNLKIKGIPTIPPCRLRGIEVGAG
ncbi:MAG: hypothetical protein ACLU4J_18595 [Butyricimonas paravirosa]